MHIYSLDSTDELLGATGADSSTEKLWSQQLYTYTVIITSSILIVLFILTMYFSCRGTSFIFIIVI